MGEFPLASADHCAHDFSPRQDAGVGRSKAASAPEVPELASSLDAHTKLSVNPKDRPSTTPWKQIAAQASVFVYPARDFQTIKTSAVAGKVSELMR